MRRFVLAFAVLMMALTSCKKQMLSENELQEVLKEMVQSMQSELPEEFEEDDMSGAMTEVTLEGHSVNIKVVLYLDCSDASAQDLAEFRATMDEQRNEIVDGIAEGVAENSRRDQFGMVLVLDAMQEYGYNFEYHLYDANDMKLWSMVVNNRELQERIKPQAEGKAEGHDTLRYDTFHYDTAEAYDNWAGAMEIFTTNRTNLTNKAQTP